MAKTKSAHTSSLPAFQAAWLCDIHVPSIVVDPLTLAAEVRALLIQEPALILLNPGRAFGAWFIKKAQALGLVAPKDDWDDGMAAAFGLFDIWTGFQRTRTELCRFDDPLWRACEAEVEEWRRLHPLGVVAPRPRTPEERQHYHISKAHVHAERANHIAATHPLNPKLHPKHVEVYANGRPLDIVALRAKRGF